MKVGLVIAGLGPGGAERILSLLSNEFYKNGYFVTVLTFDGGDVPPFYFLAHGVRHRALNCPVGDGTLVKKFTTNIKKVILLRKALIKESFDIIISFLDSTNVITLLAAIGIRVPIVVCERTHPLGRTSAKVWGSLCRALYPFAKAVVVQSKQAREYFDSAKVRVVVIPNPVLSPPQEFSSLMHRKDKLVYGIGRLSHEKGFDVLLRAFAAASKRGCGWKLLLNGDGPLREELNELRNSLGLRQAVSMPGITRSPYRAYYQASVFVLPSRVEGFPNALCEAMSCGLAVIATDSPGGTNEIIQDNCNGLLVPVDDVYAMALALDRLMSDIELRERLGRNAKQVTERFSPDRIMRMWSNLVLDLVR